MLKYLSRLAGVIGFLKLIQDLNLVSLRGLLADWMTAYAHFLDILRDYVLYFRWMKNGIQTTEVNVIVMGGIFAASVVRALFATRDRIDPQAWSENAWPSVFTSFFIYVFVPYLICRFVEPMKSVWISVTLSIVFFSVHLFAGDEDKVLYPETSMVRTEFVAVLTYVLILIGVSYVFF